MFPAIENTEAAPPSAEELAKVKAYRAARKLKMSQVPGNIGFADETRAALFDSIHGMGSALAVEWRLPEPTRTRRTSCNRRWRKVWVKPQPGGAGTKRGDEFGRRLG